MPCGHNHFLLAIATSPAWSVCHRATLQLSLYTYLPTAHSLNPYSLLLSHIAITVENLSKKFRIGTANSPGYHRLSEAVTGIPRMAWNALRRKSVIFPRPVSSESEPSSPRPVSGRGVGGEGQVSSLQPPASSLQPANDFWALKDVSFEVKQGEVVGIIGRNGAGKSTLLKILSRINEPTSGRFGIRGRVASLLEVGTGFHPELTGRENIFVSGITLGMTRAEIKKRFDEIVDFSGVEKFLDTPVKHYSSGMQVRLGFAVAAHLESEVLIVDEVLAVGDGDFQKKCLGKMRHIRDLGRTVVVVSHQMNILNALCDRGIVIKNGAISFAGSAEDAVAHYHESGSRTLSVFDCATKGISLADERAELHRAWIENDIGEVTCSFGLHENIRIVMDYSIKQTVANVAFPNFHLFDERGEYVFCTAASASQLGEYKGELGRFQASCVVPANLLNSGYFTVGVAVTCMDPGTIVSFFERAAIAFQVIEDLDQTLDEFRHGYVGPVPGPIRPRLNWTIALQAETAL